MQARLHAAAAAGSDAGDQARAFSQRRGQRLQFVRRARPVQLQGFAEARAPDPRVDDGEP